MGIRDIYATKNGDLLAWCTGGRHHHGRRGQIAEAVELRQRLRWEYIDMHMEVMDIDGSYGPMIDPMGIWEYTMEIP